MFELGRSVLATLILIQGPSAGALTRVGQFEDTRIRESSGIAVSRRNGGVLWTHNDSGDGAYLYATDQTGKALGRLRVTGASARDWEDIATGPCPHEVEEACLYIADTGDNLLLRRNVTVYAVRDPTPPVDSTERALALAIRYPNGARDVEAMFVDSDGSVHLITKGTSGSIEHYSVSRSNWSNGRDVVAHLVQKVGIRTTRRRLVTGAALSPSGRLVAIRSRRFLYMFDFTEGRLGDAPLSICADDLPSGGEAVDFLSESELILSYEADRSKPAPLYRLQCDASSSG